MNDRFLRACRREPVDRTPLWIMRQAGRYLPEYRDLRRQVDFLTLCRTPELAVEASLQPLKRFPLDAAIVFSDIMTPLEAFNCELTFSPGPKVAEPIRTAAQVAALEARPVEEAVGFVGEAVRLLRRELDGRTPVIGFCGAPFTLACYLVQGEGKEGFGAAKRLFFADPATASALLNKLTDAMIAYLRMQIAAGAQAVQIFDSWAGILGADAYRRCALPFVQRLVAGVQGFGAPVIYFANAAPHLIELAASSGADVLGVCWRTPLDEAWQRTHGHVALQGNLDPHALFADAATIRSAAADVLARMAGRPGHVMNLGHGILPDTPIAAVEALVGAVHDGARPAGVEAGMEA